MQVLYVKSDFTYFLVYYIFRYRRSIVRENLSYSFPYLSKKELVKIEKKFYHHLCDLIFESLKIVGMSKAEILHRMKYINHEPVIKHYNEGGNSVMLYTSHNGNWEWTSSFSLLLPKDKPVYQVYKEQNSKISTQIISKIRTHFGAKNIEMKEVLRQMVRMRNDNKTGMFGMVGDQSPAWTNIHYFTEFLNQDTAVITGTEQLAKKFNYPVYYVRVRKIKRGYYSCELIPIAVHPRETEEHEITEKYMRLLEEDIMHDPSTWLWSHKRWKLTRK